MTGLLLKRDGLRDGILNRDSGVNATLSVSTAGLTEEFEQREEGQAGSTATVRNARCFPNFIHTPCRDFDLRHLIAPFYHVERAGQEKRLWRLEKESRPSWGARAFCAGQKLYFNPN